MKRTLCTLFITLTLSIAVAAQAKPAETAAPKLPTAHEIVTRFVETIGGAAGMDKVKSWTAVGTVEIAPAGLKGKIEMITSAPNYSLTKLTIDGVGDFVESFDGKTAWSMDPIQGSREKTGIELQQTKLMADFDREYNLEKVYQKLEVKGIEKVGGRDAYVVVATPAGLPPQTLYFDTQSGYLVRTDSVQETPEGRQAVTVFIEETKKIDGITVPVKTRTKIAIGEINMTLTDIKPGPAVDAAKFAKPAKGN